MPCRSTDRCQTRAPARPAAAPAQACSERGHTAWVADRRGRRRATHRGHPVATCGTSGGRSGGRCRAGWRPRPGWCPVRNMRAARSNRRSIPLKSRCWPDGGWCAVVVTIGPPLPQPGLLRGLWHTSVSPYSENFLRRRFAPFGGLVQDAGQPPAFPRGALSLKGWPGARIGAGRWGRSGSWHRSGCPKG